MSAKKLQDCRDESDEGDDLKGRDKEDREFVPFVRSPLRASAFDHLTKQVKPQPKAEGTE